MIGKVSAIEIFCDISIIYFIFSEEIVRVDRISPKYGSLNGATRLTIYGQGIFMLKIVS